MNPHHRIKKVKDREGRATPDIPADLQAITFSDDILAEPEISFREGLIENVSFKERSLKSVVLEACVLKAVSFARCNLRGLRCKDVRLVECDFANAEAIGLKALRAEFINCRLTGLRAVESECQHFLISGEMLVLLNFDLERSRTASSVSATLERQISTAATCEALC